MFSPSRRTIRWVIKPTIFAISLLPVSYLLLGIVNDGLGPNPIEMLTHQTGLWGLYYLLMTLAVTPLRRVTKITWLMNLRRMFGLFAFFYACQHLLVYFWLDQYFVWSAIFEDITKRPYVTVGFSAWLLLLPLALTSTRSAIKRLGKNWQKLHKLVYPAVLLVILHFLWLVKADYAEPILYLIIFLVLLAFRTRLFAARQESTAQ